MKESNVQRGLLIAFCGAFLLSFDTMLLRLVNSDPIQMSFWRGILMFTSGLMFSLTLARFQRNSTLSLVNGSIGISVAILYGVASVSFVASAMLTSIANMLVIIATAPLWAAIGAVFILKENAPARTWIASGTALVGVAFVVGPGFLSRPNLGDMLALATAFSMAGAFVVARRASANLALAPATGGLLSAIALAPFVPQFAFARPDQLLLIGFEGLVLVPLALGLIAMAPRYLPAPQVGLFLLLETVLGPLWVWSLLGEQPTGHALIGGAIVVLTLLAHSACSIRMARLRPD